MSNLRLVGEAVRKLPQKYYELKSTEITNTRLMGVVGIHMHWIISADEECPDDMREYHQIFYYECEEDGLESVYEFGKVDDAELLVILNRYFGPLGGGIITLNIRETLYLLREFALGTPRGELHPNISRILETCGDAALGADEIDALNKKMCVALATDYAVVHYYLMRAFGRDRLGMQLLTSPNANPDNIEVISLSSIGVLRKNTIDRFVDEKGVESYLCESVVELDGKYMIVISELRVADKLVIAASRRNVFPISDTESLFKLRRSEYVIAYDVLVDGDDFEQYLSVVLGKASKRDYDTGVLFMEYQPDNSHLEQPVYTLSDDVAASYFLTDMNELIVSSFSIGEIVAAETVLKVGPLKNMLDPKGKYHFLHPALGEFIESGIETFSDFLGGFQ